MTRETHADKDIEEALQEIEGNGWRVEKSKGKSAHAWGRMYCPNKDTPCVSDKRWCIQSIWSTPKSAINHAKTLKRLVNRCIKHKEMIKENDNSE